MLCVRRTRADREFIFLGLTDANIETLKQGLKIRLTGETHGEAIPPGWTIGILYGANMEEIRLEMEKEGIISPGQEPRGP